MVLCFDAKALDSVSRDLCLTGTGKMDRRQIGTKLTLDALGLGLDLDSFDERLILQKAVYLAQLAGVNLGYFYRWYLRGPYCPDLTSDLFSMADEFATDKEGCKGWRFDETTASSLRGIETLVPTGALPVKAKALELLASVHFLVARRQVPNRDASVIRDRLLKFNKDYTLVEVTDALGKLTEHGLLDR